MKCHGENLEGGTAPSLVDGVWLYGADRNNRMRNIRFGIAQQGMPAYEDALTDGQIRDIAIYMEEVGKSVGATKPPIPETLVTNDYVISVTTSFTVRSATHRSQRSPLPVQVSRS